LIACPFRLWRAMRVRYSPRGTSPQDLSRISAAILQLSSPAVVSTFLHHALEGLDCVVAAEKLPLPRATDWGRYDARQCCSFSERSGANIYLFLHRRFLGTSSCLSVSVCASLLFSPPANTGQSDRQSHHLAQLRTYSSVRSNPDFPGPLWPPPATQTPTIKSGGTQFRSGSLRCPRSSTQEGWLTIFMLCWIQRETIWPCLPFCHLSMLPSP
jgi:hypothetical protein